MIQTPRISTANGGRFMVADRQFLSDDGVTIDTEEYTLVGGLHPTVYKTIRNAQRAAERRTWGTGRDQESTRTWVNDGLVLLFDPNDLPVVTPDTLLFHAAGLPDRISDLEFCERQIQLWGQRAERVRAGGAILAWTQGEMIG